MAEPRAIGAIRKRPWTAADEAALRKAWPDLVDARALRRFALRCARTPVAINLRAWQIGLRRPGQEPAPEPPSPELRDRGRGGCIAVKTTDGRRLFFCNEPAMPGKPYCAECWPLPKAAAAVAGTR